MVPLCYWMEGEELKCFKWKSGVRRFGFGVDCSESVMRDGSEGEGTEGRQAFHSGHDLSPPLRSGEPGACFGPHGDSQPDLHLYPVNAKAAAFLSTELRC